MTPANLPAKAIRAGLIADYMRAAGIARAVCFTCGNAAAALRLAGVDVLEVGAQGALAPTAWWTPAQIARAFPGYFDATSGHLPMPLMMDLAQALRSHLGDIGFSTLDVAAGSGETAVCLAMAYPKNVVTAHYDDAHPWTTWSPHAPLNPAVAALCRVHRRNPAK